MSGDTDSRDEESSHLFCPECGERVLTISMTGPTEQIAGPCGCRFPPGILD